MKPIQELVRASDKTTFYSYEKAKEVLQTLDVKPFSPRDLIFIILFAQDKPIHGRILLMKEMFLLYQRILLDIIDDPKFVPYRFGPYSFHLTELIHNLRNDGFVKIEGKPNSRSESFSLTQKGKTHAQKIFDKIPSDTQETIKEKRKGWDQLGVDGILNYVYTHYKSYKEKSVLKNRYKDITWGRGTG